MGTRCIRLFVLLEILVIATKAQNIGTFWHVSDHHLDPYYSADASDPTKVCPSSYGAAAPDAGPFGDYRCDSPWKLINSSVYAMKLLEPNPDFIIWTGDDTLHTGDQDKYLGAEKVVEIVGNITQLLMDVFPNTTVYPALGNHDFHPKSQIAPGGSAILTAIADLWQDWLQPQAYSKFKDNGFYTEVLGKGHRLIALNSNFWYDSNKQVSGSGDPAGEFEWLESMLTQSRADSEKVFIIGHVPPGHFELVEAKPWFYPDYNKRFNQIVRSYADIIAGQFFGHHHTDTFRIFKDGNKAVSSMLITPGVTPWMTTLPAAKDGANNPGIRLYEYDRNDLTLKDYRQYYLNLPSANSKRDDDWQLEYRATAAYNISDVSTSSLANLADTMLGGCRPKDSSCPDVFTSYFLYNSVSYNNKPCDDACQSYQLCAVTEVDYDAHDSCIEDWGNGSPRQAMLLWLATLFTPVLLFLFA